MNLRLRSPSEGLPSSFKESSEATQAQLIGRILSSALSLWLRSQVEQVSSLHVEVSGHDRQLLTGYIPKVAIAAEQVIYQGLHLSSLQLVGSNIQVNLGQVLRGKPLRLLQPIPVEGKIVLGQADFNASLASPLLTQALTDFLRSLLRSRSCFEALGIFLQPPLHLKSAQISITPGQLTLQTELREQTNNQAAPIIPLTICTGLELIDGNQLRLQSPQWLPHPQSQQGVPLADLHHFQIDLGSEVELQEFILEQEQIVCQGRIQVIPA
jgi:hypothetical protein